ncbi:MAG: hypothetical protein KIT80_23445 [Chitinophagaceae bacterium]|nr:hypothetical protein [Nitrosomonas sp.]MCW5929895.1 hypothetical protein [Chitinophagaceae bacterium]
MEAATENNHWMMMFGNIAPLVISEPNYRHAGCYARDVQIAETIENVTNDRVRGDIMREVLRLYDEGIPVKLIPAMAGCTLRHAQYVLVQSGRKIKKEKYSPVASYTRSGKMLERYVSVISAARAHGLTKHIVTRSARQDGGYITGKDLVFRYVKPRKV